MGVILMAEMEGFEPPHALRRLADFESAPFSHLGTSPKRSHYNIFAVKIKIIPLCLPIFYANHLKNLNCLHLSTLIAILKTEKTEGTLIHSPMQNSNY